MKGIDVCVGRTINFKALKKAGYDFAIFRAGVGSVATQKDKSFDSYMTQALEAGLHIGAYWFIYARSIPEAQQNAIAFNEVLKPYRGMIDLPVYIDYEYDSTRYYEQQTGRKETKDFATAAIQQAALQMQNLGWYTGLYLNPDYIRNRVNYDALKMFTLWLAQWKKFDNNPAYSCEMWQYSGSTMIPESVGSVDLNHCFDDNFPQAIRDGGYNGFTKTETSPDDIPKLPEDFEVGGHGIYGRSITIFDNGTWIFNDNKDGK